MKSWIVILSILLSLCGCKEQLAVEEMPVTKHEMPPRLIGIWLIPGLSYVEDRYYMDKYGNRYNDFEYEKFQKMVHLVDVPDLEVLSMLRDYEFGIDIVDGNPLTDISFLENFPKIDSLYLGDVKISNFEPLKKLTNIRRLELGNVAIPSLELLQYFTNLQRLEFRQDYPGIVDGLALRNLTSIKHLTLNNERIVNLEAIFDLSGEEAPSLPNLGVFKMPNYYWDREYWALEKVKLEQEKIGFVQDENSIVILNNNINNNIDALLAIKEPIESINIRIQAGKTDISFIENLKDIKYVTIRDDNDNIVSLEPLRHLENLVEFRHYSSDHKEIDCSLFMNAKNLKYLNLFNNRVKNIAAVAHLENLEELSIKGNSREKIDGSSLRNLAKLRFLDLSDNEVENEDIIFNLPNIEVIRFSNHFRRQEEMSTDDARSLGYRGLTLELKKQKYRILQYRANVRSKPTTKSETVAILNLNAEVEILENTWISEKINGAWAYWYKIAIGNTIGYIFGGNLAIDTLITDIDKNGINDYFHFRFSGWGTINPSTDVIIYINNQRISTNVLGSEPDLSANILKRVVFKKEMVMYKSGYIEN